MESTESGLLLGVETLSTAVDRGVNGAAADNDGSD
jgi:hypothetical protein